MGKTLADLQSNISISAENAVTGTLLWVDNYTGFSSDPTMQSGNYIALKISAEALGEALEDATITATYNGRTVTLDSDRTIIVRLAEGEDTITFTATKEGYSEGRLTLDFSGLTLEEEPFKFLIHSNNTNVVIDEDGEYLPSGSAVEITGQVPWSTSGNQNDFSVTINTKQEIVGEWEGANVRVYYDAISPVVLYSGSMSLTPPSTIGTLTFTLPITAAAITDGTIYFEITELDDQSQVVNTYSVEADISNLTLQEAPYNPETDPYFELTGVVYNGHTYDVSDFISGGTLTRGDGTSQNNLVLTGATIKYCEIDPNAEQNYYLAFTSRTGAEAEHQGNYYEFIELSLNNPINNPPSPHTLPQTFLIRIDRNINSILGSGRIRTSSTSTTTKNPTIKLVNCIWETDPRSQFINVYLQTVANGEYNGTPLSTYFSADNSQVSYSTNTYNNVNGYYGFMNIMSPQGPAAENITLDFYGQLDATKLPDGEVTHSGGVWNGVYKYDASTAYGDRYKITAPGYIPKQIFGLTPTQLLVSDTYSNGLNVRNIGIKPLSTDAKNDGFGDYCNLTFTPIDPATATVVNDEVNVSVSGTINKRSASRTAGSNLTDYKPLYKNWPNSYGSIDKKDNSLNLDYNTYFFIVEVDCGFRDLIGSQMWQCKGFTSTQTTFTTLAHPSVLSTSKKTIWAIPIQEGTTSVSIKCVPPSSNCFTEVTYNFDLTNVTYGTIS